MPMNLFSRSAALVGHSKLQNFQRPEICYPILRTRCDW